MKGKTVVATGATSGIGEAAVLALARMGARIVFVARDEKRAGTTMRALETAAPRLGHRVHLADLSRMAEAHRVGLAIAQSEPRIDVLINNAGAIFTERQVTPESLERTFALNHMAYFIVTAELREKLAASAPARIVSTSSTAHVGSSLERRLGGTGVTANCLHPGVVATRFGDSASGLTGMLLPLARRFFIRPGQGADTIVHLASSPEVANATGQYFTKRKAVEPSAAARDDVAAKKLWEASEALAGPPR
jgi:NAD(P)-dependent dehydrogenase (short-subunit alcohol dehydrogenase family)